MNERHYKPMCRPSNGASAVREQLNQVHYIKVKWLGTDSIMFLGY